MKYILRTGLLLFFIVIVFLAKPVFAETAYDLANTLNTEMKTGQVLAVMKWDAEEQKTVIFDPSVHNATSPNNFVLEEGFSYLVLTNLKGTETIEWPYRAQSPTFIEGWNLVTWSSELKNFSKYGIKQITYFDPSKQEYADIIVGFNDHDLSLKEGDGCWIYTRETNVTGTNTPHAIYGSVTLDGKGVPAVVVIINTDKDELDITECNGSGKFVYDLLNLGWSHEDKILISASLETVPGTSAASSFLVVNGKVPSQRVDLELEIKKAFPWEMIFVALLAVVIVVIGIILVKKKRKERRK